MSLVERVDAILGAPVTAFVVASTCPRCGDGFEVDHVGEPSTRHTDAEVSCRGCGREFVVSVTVRPKPSNHR